MIINIINQKGGVAKTTTTIAISKLLSNMGKKVLVIDLDHQGNLSQTFDILSRNTVSNVFLDKDADDNIKNYISRTQENNIDIISCDTNFTFVSQDILMDINRVQQFILDKALSKIKNEYDFIILDNAPSYNNITVNGLACADYVLIPSEADKYSNRGFGELIKRIREVKANLNPRLEILGMFLTKANTRLLEFQEYFITYQENLEKYFVPVVIRKMESRRHNFDANNNSLSLVRDYKYLLSFLNILDEQCQENLEKEVISLLEDEVKKYDKSILNKSFLTEYLEYLIDLKKSK